MTNSAIKRVLNKINKQNELSKTDSFYEASVGFRRFSCLPNRVRKNINIACVLKGELNTNSVQDLLNSFNEVEFVNWLRLQ